MSNYNFLSQLFKSYPQSKKSLKLSTDFCYPMDTWLGRSLLLNLILEALDIN